MSLASRFETYRPSNEFAEPLAIAKPSMHYGKYLLPLFANPFVSVRTNAFQSAINLIREDETAADQIIGAYLSVLLCQDRLIARHALSFLPQIAEVCPEHSDMLIRAAVGAGTNKYGKDLNTILPEAMKKVEERRKQNMTM
ncbi:unnamed protein product, partial [Mesorhabditis belari]|uniref:Vitellogenin n=1 Tax=Mesorhabditis belari TaxID=2138241 RepID=A0AAF3EX43_9BILA